jgi:hypothetical protein
MGGTGGEGAGEVRGAGLVARLGGGAGSVSVLPGGGCARPPQAYGTVKKHSKMPQSLRRTCCEPVGGTRPVQQIWARWKTSQMR